MASFRYVTDLVVVVMLALVGFGGFLVLGPSPPALVLALPLLLLLPGYVIVSSLYPRNTEVSTVSLPGRIALSVAVSLAVVPGVAILLDFVTGIYPLPVLASLAGLTVLGALLAFARRLSIPASDRMGMSPLARSTGWADRYLSGSKNLRARSPLEARRGADVFLNLIIFGSILVFAASVGIAAMVPQDDAFTEAYLATTDGGEITMVQEPGSLSSAQRESLVAVIENQEGTETEYTVVVASQQVGGDGSVQSQEVLDKQTKTIADGESWQVPVPASGGGDQIAVNVYEGGQGGDQKPDYHLVLRQS